MDLINSYFNLSANLMVIESRNRSNVKWNIFTLVFDYAPSASVNTHNNINFMIELVLNYRKHQMRYSSDIVEKPAVDTCAKWKWLSTQHFRKSFSSCRICRLKNWIDACCIHLWPICHSWLSAKLCTDSLVQLIMPFSFRIPITKSSGVDFELCSMAF